MRCVSKSIRRKLGLAHKTNGDLFVLVLSSDIGSRYYFYPVTCLTSQIEHHIKTTRDEISIISIDEFINENT